MSPSDTAQTLIRQLGDDIGMADLAFDAEGRLSLTFDDLLVTFHHKTEPVEMISIYCDLGEVPVVGSKLALMLFEANLQSWLRKTMVIGIERSAGHIMGVAHLPIVTIDYAFLRYTIENMARIGNKLQQELEHADWSHAPAAAMSPPDDATEPPPLFRA